MDKEANKRVAEMEEALNKSNKVIEEFRAALEKFENERESIKKLSKYYTEKWMDDYNLAENGEIDPEMPQGVLSEDALYDMLGDNYYLGLDLLKLATDIITND